MHVVLIEDDQSLSRHLISSLNEGGITVDHISDDAQIRSGLKPSREVDAIILDRLIGDYDTKDSIEKIRSDFPASSIVVISAIDTPLERIDLLNLGVDDYIGKPFCTDELIARLRAVERRKRSSHPNDVFVDIGDFQIDVANRFMVAGDKRVPLSAKEFAMLRLFAKEARKIYSRAELLDAIWGKSESIDSNIVEVTVANLRKKMNSLNTTVSIKNLRFVGYWLET